ncbi:MAG: radical SAM protein, partial [Eggerthellaceae bacterium]|nr:radical SAM protein [Eggerthellaceae bacterium]
LMVSAMTMNGRWNCNQKCVHCYAAGQEQAEEAELSTDDWKRIIDNCRTAGVTQLTFTGGEPTMRDDLFELIEYARWFVTRLNTNGIRLTRDYCKRLRAASIDSVQITFYSSDEAIHDELVGASRFADTVAGIENALAEGINLSVNTPLCTANRDYVKTLEFLHGLGVTYVTCSGLITTGNAAKPESEQLQLDESELKQILRDAADYCYAHDMEISFTSPGWIEPGFCNELGMNDPACGACLSNMAVTPAGHVVPCQSWLSGTVLGDMRSDAWEGIWNSERCKAIRANSAKMGGSCPLRKHEKAEGEEA